MRLLIKAMGFLVVMSVVLVGTLFLIPADRLGNILSDQLTRQTGRVVALGDTRMTIWPVIGLAVTDLEIGNADWGVEKAFFTARRAAFGLDPVAALRGQVEFRSVEAENPVLNLETAADGRTNWTFGGQAPASDANAAPPVLLRRLVISDGQFSHLKDGKTTLLSDVDIAIEWPGQSNPMRFNARISPARSPIELTGQIDRPLSLLTGEPARLSLTLGTVGGTVAFTGLAGFAPEAQGDMRLDLSDTPAMLAALGLGQIDLPKGLGHSASGSVQVTVTRDRQVALRDGTLALDGTAVGMAADIDLRAKPRINARINASKLDLSALSGEAGSPDVAPQGWPKAPIDASFLGTADGELALVAEKILLGGYEFDQTRALITLDNSRAVFDLRELRAFNGLITGQVVLNNRTGLSARADLAFAEVELEPLLKQTLGTNRIGGPAEGSLSLLTSGISLHELVAQLDGTAFLRAGPGRISGIDLDKALTGSVSGGTTVFDQAVGTFSIENGVVRTSDVQANLPRLRATAQGRIDLPPKTLDVLFTVLAPEAREGQGLAVPIRVKGPWNEPQIRVDASVVVDRNFSAERDKLKARTEEKLNDALQNRLGVTVKEGQTVGDSLRQSLEERAVRGLQDLLGR